MIKVLILFIGIAIGVILSDVYLTKNKSNDTISNEDVKRFIWQYGTYGKYSIEDNKTQGVEND